MAAYEEFRDAVQGIYTRVIEQGITDDEGWGEVAEALSALRNVVRETRT
ncbi:hypothetical protein [Kitasatospora purpeofusca]